MPYDDDAEQDLAGDQPEPGAPDVDAVAADEALPAPSRSPEQNAEPRAAPSARTLAWGAAFVVLLGVIGFNVAYVLKSARRQSPRPADSGATTASHERESSTRSANAASTVAFESQPIESPEADDTAEPVPSAQTGDVTTEAFEDDGDEGPPSVAPERPKPEQRALRGTVRDAAARSCSTSAVDGLSRQIIAQARCLDPKAFVSVPRRPNLSVASNVFLYLDAPARDHFLKVLDANPKKTMKVHSALRTVAQQYLLRRWAVGKRCGIELATPPGESNHESGLGLDISEPGAWRNALEAEGFRWLGSIDRVHFDYKGPGAASRANVDVKAFQQLWNRNHRDDLLPENGRYTPATESRLEKSPASGFSLGPRCDR